MQDPHLILGIHITHRLQHASEVQRLLTEAGSAIKTRLGLHEVSEGDSPNGLVLLEIRGTESVADDLMAKLNAIAGVEVQKMVFCH